MKVKNIVFSGFMAMVLAGACGAANAEIIVASQKYVDTKVATLNTADAQMSEKITALEDANKEGGSVATAIADAQTAADNAQGAVDALAEKMDLTSADSDLSQALATKENTANKITTTNATYFTNGKVVDGALTIMASDNTNFPTIATAVEIADAKAQDVLTKVNANAGNLSTITANVEKLMGADTVAGSVAYQVKQEETRAMAAEAQVLTDANAYTNEKVGALDGKTGKDVADGNYVVQTTEEDGIVTVSRQAFDTTISTAEGAEHSKVTAPTTDAVVTYVDDRVQSVADTVGDASAAIGTLTTNLSAEVDRAKAAEQKIATYDEDGDLVGGSVKANADAITALTNGAVQDNTDAIAAEKSRAEGAEAGLQTAIDAINNTTTGILATAKAYTNSEMTKFYANASECVTSSESNNCIMSAKLDGENNVQYVWISLTSPAE